MVKNSKAKEKQKVKKEEYLQQWRTYNLANEDAAPKFLHAIWKNPFSSIVNNC
jgi:hypothetical protein